MDFSDTVTAIALFPWSACSVLVALGIVGAMLVLNEAITQVVLWTERKLR